MSPVVAIDGPAGSGKSTVAKALAQRLQVVHVDTGAYYRAATLLALRTGLDPAQGADIAALVARTPLQRRHGRTLLDGEDVEEAIRGPAVTSAVSAVSAQPDVRAALLPLQRREASGGAVVEGRDAGTVVVPDAQLKVWLTASVDERASRRARQLGTSDAAAVAHHQRAIVRRDRQDAAQMARAPDVVEIDTTGRSVVEIVEQLADLAVRRADAESA